MKKQLNLVFVIAALIAVQVQAQTEAHTASASAPDAAIPEFTLTSNVNFVSDYRFRGVSQTWRLPAVQGGFDYSHSSGFYLGTWASNVSGNTYNNGAGLELDLYGGYKLAVAQDLTLDLGALAYIYPGARLNRAPGVATDKKYDNLDLYAGLAMGAFNAKLSIAASDYFGLKSSTAGYAYFNSLAAAGSSKGSAYLDLNYRFDLGSGVNLDAHLGHLAVRRYSALSYTDLKLSVSKEFSGLTVGAALVATDASKALYQAVNAAGNNAKRVAGTALVFSVGRSF